MAHAHAMGKRWYRYGAQVALPNGEGTLCRGLVSASSDKMAAAIALKGTPEGSKLCGLVREDDMSEYQRGYYGL